MFVFLPIYIQESITQKELSEEQIQPSIEKREKMVRNYHVRR